ncbi:MAG: hypothetical protein COS85_09990 [Armatimonadetes bacterium CG07_land_8_20_14_0_80_59_28]|nr:MAG: hypothetical protein COS85_09990 [Armatimonadetes bacterium CG07_land_8_20_14_0_80_59_28]
MYLSVTIPKGGDDGCRDAQTGARCPRRSRERVASDSESAAEWIEALLADKGVTRDEYREILSRLDVLDREIAIRFDAIDRRFEAIDRRFDVMVRRFDMMDERMDRIHERFDTLYDRMLVQTRWTVGTIALFGTLITILLAVAQFKP